MAWTIKCGDGECASETWTQNIVDLKRNHCDAQGWFLCGTCGSRGYIPKQYDLQEGGEPWKPYLKGIIQPNGYNDDVYQPFAFLTSDSPDEAPSAIWFTYYKDTRDGQGAGRLKMGYGPGGPPVFKAKDVVDFVAQMIERGCLDAGDVKKALESAARKP